MNHRLRRALMPAVFGVLMGSAGMGHADAALPVFQAPPGFVSVNQNPTALNLMNKFVGPGLELVDGFVTTEDGKNVEAGKLPQGNRYIMISRYQDPAKHFIPAQTFSAVTAKMREGTLLDSTKDSANAEFNKRFAHADDNLKNLHIETLKSGTIVLDLPSCIGQAATVDLGNGSRTVKEVMVTTLARVNGQFFLIATYAHDQPADTQWLSTDAMSWLRGICRA
jgi:hypothetical protein